MHEMIDPLLKKRQAVSDPENKGKWCIKASQISGNGVFSCKDIEVGEEIFNEQPLVIGPRSAALPATCAVCWRMDVALWECQGRCRLPVCGPTCSAATNHKAECGMLARRVRPQEHWSPLLYRALAVFRCLLLEEEERIILSALSKNNSSKYPEIKFLEEELEEGLSSEEEKFLELCCRVLNGVAFEMEVGGAGSVSWRGLYPLAGTMNHSCSPNTRHHFSKTDGQPAMTLIASRFIAAGEELTTSYCPLLWSTMARRHFLQLTKEFLCTCQRCSDPTEFGTHFSAEVCECGGLILQEWPLDLGCSWRCGKCQRTLSAKEVLGTRRTRSHPDSHHAVRDKLDFILAIGRNKPYTVVSEDELTSKEKAIREVMAVNDRLRFGESRIRGMLKDELNATQAEITRRKSLQKTESL